MSNVITAENEEAVKRVLNDVFDNFDFEKVKKTMDVLDWKWDVGTSATPDEERFAVPTLEKIKKEAAHLMWDCANTDVDVIATGGFRVEKDFTDPDDPWMRLSFEVAEWDSNGLDTFSDEVQPDE